MPNHIKFLLFHAACGIVFAAFLVWTMLFFDVANLRYLMLKSDMKWIAFITLMVSMSITFGSVQMGIAIMRMGREDETKTGGRGPKIPLIDRFLQTHLLRAEPVRVKSGSQR